MPDTITLDIPAHLAAAAQATPEELKTELAIHLYTQDRLTLEEASELAGVEKEELLMQINYNTPPEISALASLKNDTKMELTAITGYVQLLEFIDNDSNQLSQKQRDFLSIISQKAQKIEDLFHEYLDLAYIKYDRISLKLFEDINLSEIIEDIITSNQKSWQSVRVKNMIQDKSPSIWADKRRIIEITYKLIRQLSNDFSKCEVSITSENNGKCITIGVISSCYTFKELTLQFMNSGKITLGDKFKMVRYLIEKHGGTFHAENLEEGGSRVTFTLPVRPPEGL